MMNTLRLALVLAFTGSAALVGCSVQTDDGRTDGGDAGRGLGKADGVFGSCIAPDGDDTCGNKAAEGNCFCDEVCSDFGDCCADKADVCGGDGTIDPTPQLCLSDSTCKDGQFCDHTECLSGCPNGGICPAVCFGECTDGEDECGINPLTVFCQPGTVFNVEECACVPIDDQPCHTLDKEQCEDTDDCDWVTTPGFPGPISMCQDADEPECDINPATVFCAPGKVFDLGECACVPVDPPEGCEPPDDSYEFVSGDTLANNIESFVGKKIWLTGDSKPGFAICTQLACTIDNPCCNSCGAGIDMDVGAIDVEMSGIGCGGNNCDVMNNCEYGLGESFSAWGTLDKNFGVIHLDIDGHCGVE